MFEINKVDTSNNNEKGVALINLDTITKVSQQPKHYSNQLYDGNGKLVSQDEDAPFFEIDTNEGLHFVVEETQYKVLKKELVKLGFTEIEKINRKDEKGVALVKLDNVKAIVEQRHVQDTNEDGTPKADTDGNPIYKPTQYALIRRDGDSVNVLETEYKRLVKELTK